MDTHLEHRSVSSIEPLGRTGKVFSRPRWHAQEWAGTQGSTHGTAEGRAQGASAPEVRAGVLPFRWQALHPISNRGGAPLRVQAGRASEHWLARAQAYLLFPPRHAGCGAEGNSGARRTLDAEHDPSVHAF